MTVPTGSTSGGGPTNGSRREELLGIAGALFAERGFKNTTVRDIADAAGILSGSLHGWLWLVVAFIGNVVGTRLRPFFGLEVERLKPTAC